MKRNSGFTLTELMVVIALMGILMAIAAPAFVNWLPGYKMNSAIRDLYSHLQQAKITAIKTNSQCTIAFNQTICGTTYAYVVFIDKDGNFNYVGCDKCDGCSEAQKKQRDASIIKHEWESNAGFSLDVNEGGGDGISFATNDDGLPAIGFRSNGIPVRKGGGDPGGGVFLITTNPDIVKKGSVFVSPAGSIRIQ